MRLPPIKTIIPASQFNFIPSKTMNPARFQLITGQVTFEIALIPLYKAVTPALESGKRTQNLMRNSFLLLSALLSVAALGTGCANVERKFGRGMANTHEIIRGGEFRRTM